MNNTDKEHLSPFKHTKMFKLNDNKFKETIFIQYYQNKYLSRSHRVLDCIWIVKISVATSNRKKIYM